jgi:hypothetical protein
MNLSPLNRMSADQYIDMAIDQGILYHRELLKNNLTRITFTKLFPSPEGSITMQETKISATSGNAAEAAEQAYMGIIGIE